MTANISRRIMLRAIDEPFHYMVNMTRYATFPYVLFASAFAILGLAFAVVADQLRMPPIINWFAYPVTTSISLLIASRFGRINYRALFVTACILFIVVQLAIFGILKSLARQTPGGHVDVLQFIATLGWQQIALSLAAIVGMPLLALFFMRHLRLVQVPA